MNIERLMQALSEILSDKYGAKITIKAVKKENTQEDIA